MYFLAVDYGYEGWKLTEFASAQEAIDSLKSGQTHGQSFKILKEMDLNIKEGKHESLLSQ